jgi:pimeloyl-ACP methyl ester carboxylesterase
MGHVSQMAAGLTHWVSEENLGRIGARVARVVIVSGDEDNLVRPAGSRALKKGMAEAELVEWAETGHAIHGQWAARFNTLVEQAVCSK